MQTIVQDMPIAVQQSHEEALAGLPSAEQVKELMLLYQLCIKLMGSGDPNRVVEIALELLKKRTGAAVVGFLAVNDEGGLAAEAGDSAGSGRPRDAQPIAHGAGLAAGPRRVDRQPGDRAKTPTTWATLPTASAHRWCGGRSKASDRRSARSTSICSRGGSANRISTSSSRWPTWWRSRWCGPGS